MQEHAADMPPASRRSLAIIFFILLTDIMGLTILFPVAPYIVERYSKEALMVTLITVIYAAAQFFSAPLIGKLGDRYGRRPVLLISIFGSIIGYLIFGIGGALWVLFLSRVIDGITGGNQSTAAAVIADISPPKDLTKNFALVGLAWGLGLVLGPALGGVFGQINLVAPVFVAAFLSAIELILVFLFLPESLPIERRVTAPMQPRDYNPFITIGEMVAKPGLGMVLLVICLFNFAFNGVNSTQSVYIIAKFGVQVGQQGFLLVMVGITIGVVQLVLIPRIVPRFGEKAVANTTLFIYAAGLIVATFSPYFWLIFIIFVFNSGVSGFLFPTLTTLSVTRVSRRDQGQLMGVTTALNSLANMIGPLAAGAIYDHVAPAAPYYMGAIALVVAGFVLMQVHKPTPVESPVPAD